MTEYAKGLDVSHHQPTTLAWDQVSAQDGISFAIPRFAYGLAKDETFDAHLSKARAAGLWTGAYIFPRGDQNIDEQAALFTSVDYNALELPMFVDIERDPRTGAVQINADQTRRLLEEIARITGKLPGVYTAKAIWEAQIGKNRTWANRYWLWVANYTTDPAPALPDIWSNWLIWQHKVAPINSYPSNIDQNVFNGTVQDLACQFRDAYADWYFQWPVDDQTVTQPFGVNPQHYAPLLPVPTYGNVGLGHEGIDIRAPNGSNVYAAQNGIVKSITNSPSYGINVRIDHQNGLESGYAHLQQALVTVGQHVKIGERIALADNTGASTGAHLHFFAKRQFASTLGHTSYPSDLVDPTRWMRFPQAPGVQMRMIYSQSINIRSAPSVSGNDIGDVEVGEIVTAWPETGATYIRIIAHGITGYALQKHFEPAVIASVALRVTTVGSNLYIRSGNASSYPVIGSMPPGATLTGYPVQGDLYWKINYNGLEGWSAAQYLEVIA